MKHVERHTPEEGNILTNTLSVIESLKRAGGLTLNSQEFDFLNGVPITLTHGEFFNTFTAGMLVPYVLPRIPMELIAAKTDDGKFSIKPTRLVLTNNHEMFAAGENQDRLRTAPSRRRWYIVDEEKNERTVYLHIRDEDEGGTDLIEILSMLAVLHTLKKAEFFQVWQHIVGRSNFPPQEGTNEVFLNTDYFEQWKKTPFTVQLDFDSKRGSAVDKTVVDFAGRLEQVERTEKKPFLLIGNDFSLRMTLFTLVLNGEQLKFLREFFSRELQMARVYLEHLNITHLAATASLKDFVEKYVLLTLLNKSYRRQQELKDIYDQVFTDENYKRLGYQRLLDGVREKSGKRSLLAEPVDYWDPKKLDSSVLSDESSYVADLFRELSILNQPILSIPYLVGEISAELAAELVKNGMVDQIKMGFVGKMGNPVDGTKRLERGQIVIPIMVFEGSSPNELIYPAIFNITPDSGHVITASIQGVIVTVPAVILQRFDDFTRHNSLAVCADMEQYHLVKRLRELGLHTRIIPAFYVSDNSVSPRARKKGHYGETLGTPLGPIEGSVAVCLATLFELDQLTKTADIRQDRVGLSPARSL